MSNNYRSSEDSYSDDNSKPTNITCLENESSVVYNNQATLDEPTMVQSSSELKVK